MAVTSKQKKFTFAPEFIRPDSLAGQLTYSPKIRGMQTAASKHNYCTVCL